MKSNPDLSSALSSKFKFSIIEASSIGCVAYSRLKEGGEGTVYGVFDAAINIIFPGGLVSLVSEIVERGPLNITLRMPGESKMSSIGVKVGDKVWAKGFTMEVTGRQVISFSSAVIYSPRQRLTLPILTDDEIESNLEVVRKTAILFGNKAGLGELLALVPQGLNDQKTGDLNIFASSGLPRIARLEQAFRLEDKGVLRDAVIGLIGLGPGLTPSSDDMLAGLVLLCVLYKRNRRSAPHATRLIAHVIGSEAYGRTTFLSEEYLKQAASGRGNEPVMRLCSALLTGEPESVEQETKCVLAIGETSGTDTILGIVLGTMLCIG